MRKTLAVNHTAAKTDATPIPIDNQTCQHCGGVIDAMRSSMAKLFMGGMKLMAVLSVEFGSREIGSESTYGMISRIMIGIINDCASLISLTAQPMAIIREPNTR